MTRADEPWSTRPYTGIRSVQGQHYWRPSLGIWRLWFIPKDILHTTQAIALTSIAATGAVVLAGVRVWQHLTETTDEIGD